MNQRTVLIPSRVRPFPSPRCANAEKWSDQLRHPVVPEGSRARSSGLLEAVIDHPLMPSRRRSFTLSNYGESPVVRSLRVWKGDPGK